MGRSKSSPWIVGTILLCLVLFGGAWLLVIAPKFDDVEDVELQTAAVIQQNDLLRAANMALSEQASNLDAYKAELADVRTQIPTDAELADLLRALAGIAEGTGVTIVSVGAGDATVLAPVVSTMAPEVAPAAEPVPDDGAEPADEGAAGDAVTPEPTEATGIEGFVFIPLTLDVLGQADAVRAFVAALQTGLDRLLLVDSLTATAQSAVEADGGRPATAIGDIELTLTAYAYVLVDVGASVDDVIADADQALPAPSADQNPFAPNVRPDTGTGTDSTD